MRKALSTPELALWLQLRALRSSGFHFRRQSPEGPYILDFVCRSAKLVVEVDGGHHATAEQAEHDRQRDAYLASRGFRVLRFWSNDVIHEMDGVMRSIVDALGACNAALATPDKKRRIIPRYNALTRLGLRKKKSAPSNPSPPGEGVRFRDSES